MITETEKFATDAGAAYDEIMRVLPGASPYMAEALCLAGGYNSAEKLKETAARFKESLGVSNAVVADDIIIDVMLANFSPAAAEHKVRLLKSARLAQKTAEILSLNDEDKNLLLTYYAAPGGAKLFIDEYEKRSGKQDISKDDPELAKIIRSFLESARARQAVSPQIIKENRDFINSLAEGKKISAFTAADLDAICAAPGASRLKPVFENLEKDLLKEKDDSALAAGLTAKTILGDLTPQDARSVMRLAKAIQYPLLADDLQKIALKYMKLKTVQEIREAFDAVLKRLANIDDPVENLGLAVRVITDGRKETLEEAEEEAARRRDKIIFMRKLGAHKYFHGSEDELTAVFYGQNTIDDILSMFNHILRGLPHNGDINENADIGLKVLLKKLPARDADAQAEFRKNNKLAYSVDALENEALESYLGVKSKEEVLDFIRGKLSAYGFWKQNSDKHCYALSVLIDEINGSVTPFSSDLSLFLLESEVPEQAADIMARGLAPQTDLDKGTVVAAYKKFLSSSKDPQDAARRAVNMLQ